MLLLVLSSFGILVFEDEMNLESLVQPDLMDSRAYLVGCTTFIGAKHDHVWRSV
jgi:hypothetical protein